MYIYIYVYIYTHIHIHIATLKQTFLVESYQDNGGLVFHFVRPGYNSHPEVDRTRIFQSFFLVRSLFFLVFIGGVSPESNVF